ncbi:MAG: Fur family transcriptional regulator [Candidatus Methylomirabilota bacterium]
MNARRTRDAFHEQGLRLTRSRRVILQVLSDSPDHLKVAELHRRALAVDPRIGLASVYRTMELLERLGLVRHVHMNHRHRHYAPAADGHGHHLVCNGCGRVVEFSDCQIERLAKALTRRTHFVIEGHSIELYGRCPDCCRTPDRKLSPGPTAPAQGDRVRKAGHA